MMILWYFHSERGPFHVSARCLETVIPLALVAPTIKVSRFGAVGATHGGSLNPIFAVRFHTSNYRRLAASWACICRMLPKLHSAPFFLNPQSPLLFSLLSVPHMLRQTCRKALRLKHCESWMIPASTPQCPAQQRRSLGGVEGRMGSA